MGAMLRRLPAVAGLTLAAGIGAEVAGDRAFARLVRRDVQALHARAAPGRAGTVTQQMLADLPEPVRRYLHYTGVVGKPFPATVRLRQKGRMRAGPGQRWIPLDAEEHYSVQPPGFVWAGVLHLGPLPLGRARGMYAGGEGRMLVKAASLWPVVDASGEQVGTVEEFDAVVLGSAVYMGQWLKPARELAEHSAAALATRPVWLFSSGPVGEPAKPADNPVDVTKILQATKARDHQIFTGKLAKKHLSFPDRAMASAIRAQQGDFRNWAQIRAWAASIADTLLA